MYINHQYVTSKASFIIDSGRQALKRERDKLGESKKRKRRESKREKARQYFFIGWQKVEKVAFLIFSH